ncbi:MAG TPA: ATP-binding protein [Smithellaceae bacterium]|nr:ATP-binding protein [Smithellaceae bacterium]
MIERNSLALLKEVIEQDNKMAFVSGPRQVGKTTLAKLYLNLFGQGLYLNWDNVVQQKKILTDPLFFEKADWDRGKPFLLIFDEIHKYSRWKNYLKGIYDDYKENIKLLVTGSGRLELFKKGGDSLLGRYFSVPLFPLSMGELKGRLTTFEEFRKNLEAPSPVAKNNIEHYNQLFRFSGFPEPFSRANTSFYNRWFSEQKTLLVREDIRDATAIRDISLLELLTHLLPVRIGNPLSLNALKEDVGVAFETVRDWLLTLEKFFYLFRILPFSGKLKRTLRKEAKIYLYNWVEIDNESCRFENLVALHLLKAVKNWQATGEANLDLNYLRDKEKREVDFILSEKGKPLCLIECKYSDTNISPNLVYFQKKLDIPHAVQLVHQEGICRKLANEGFNQWVISANRWLEALP